MFRIGLFALIIVTCIAIPTRAAERPNIIFILADDMGWADLGCYGADVMETPAIDALAAQSVRFTDAYAMPVCSPTRASWMTGKHAARLHITIWAEGALDGGPKNRKMLQGHALDYLPHSETTIAKRLQDAGYMTALIGKWHLGNADYFPETHGYDINIGGTHWGAPQTFFWPYRGSGTYGDEYRYVPHLEFGHDGEYLTDRLTDEAITVIDHANGKPFFIYLAHHAPHTPIEAKAEDVAYFTKKITPQTHHQQPIYAAMCRGVDQSVGKVLAHLKDRKLDQNTIVIYASDNGGYIGVDRKFGKPGDRHSGHPAPITNNFPLRSGKGSCYEGGIRVPLIIHWPGGMTPGECHEPVILTDLFHTIATAAGLSVPTGAAPDGVDLSPLVKTPAAKLQRDALFWHYPHYYDTTSPVGAIRSGPWKLLEYFEDNHVELYNLADNLSEKTDLAKQMPDKAEALRKRLHDWRTEVSAAMPTANPNFKPKKMGKDAHASLVEPDED